ncbi:alpha-ribazole-5-phosphate synthase [Clostridium oryzae]|uniref:Alpha-ribazole kinase n=1 Tax=Clostridium oryzae TaxID=1450648 RepID=A0A1V4IBE3_9CLOT|nr:alpha-ribazole-5-phosphate synthase [Clostridium oryzae]OPJ57318.1 hypothetical protein CLORY_41860 [Clostridium oryzae]
MNISKVRDLTLIDISDDKIIVIACDSCGSIGLKEKDELKVSPFFVASFTSRVVIMEVMAAAAEIVTLTNAVCCEMEPTGNEMIKGIKKELSAAHINDIVLTGSTEENFRTFTTAVGITAVGIAEKKKLKINNIKHACKIISVGIPKVGADIQLENDNDIVGYDDLKYLLKCSNVYEIVPVGSKGILFEAELLAKNNGLRLAMKNDIGIDVRKTCGPATVIIAAVDESAIDNIKLHIDNVNIICDLIKEKH